MLRLPNLLIWPDKVYGLTVEESDSKRASDYFLIDYEVKGVNFSDPFDKWTASLGVSKEFLEDYALYKLNAPVEWILIRFLNNHVKADSLDLLSGDRGQALTSSNFRECLGHEVSEIEAEELLRTLLRSWARVHPKGALELKDLYVSTDLTPEILKRALEALEYQDHIKELGQNVFVVKEKIFA